MKKKIKRENKRSFNMINNPDSIWNRSSSNRKVATKQMGGDEIQKALDIGGEEQKDISSKSPIKMMDIIYQIWGLGTDRGPNSEEDDDNDDEE